MIKIKSVGILKDGGSIEVRTNVGTFFIDNRIETETRGAVYRGKMTPENLVLEGERLAVKAAIAAFQKPTCKCNCGTCKK